MAVPYGSKTYLTYTIQRGVPVNIRLPGFLEDRPHDISGVRWIISGRDSTVLPTGLSYNLIADNGGKWVTITGATTVPETTISVTVVARSTYTLNEKPRPVTWVLTLKLEGNPTASTPPEPVPQTPTPTTPAPTPPQTTITVVDWSTAYDLARSGDRIRMISWSDRWLEFEVAGWYLVIVNPITRVQISRRIVEMTDGDTSWFTGAWTTYTG